MSKNTKMTIASVIALITFVAFAGVTTQSVLNMSDLISRASFADKNGVPNLWSDAAYSSSVATNTEVKPDGDHLSYVVTLENKDSASEVYLTDLASRITDTENTGFISFSSDSLEYSYSKNASKWSKVDGENEEGTYRLSSAIRIGATGSSDNKVYLRYNISPQDGNVTDRISFRLQDSEGAYGVAVSDSSIAYEATNPEIVAVENSRSVIDDNSGESAFTEPLGATSTASSLSTISSATAVAAAISPEVLTASTIIIIAILGLFAGSVIVYFVIKAKNTKKPQSKK